MDALEPARILLSLGGLLLLGLLADAAGQRTSLPRVTLMLLCGLLVGPGGFDLLPPTILRAFDLTADMALLMVGFLLGGHFTRRAVRSLGKQIVVISLAVVVVTAAVVFAGLYLTGLSSLAVALLLAGIAPATDPAATADVVEELGAKGPFSQTLLGIVAIDDAWGLMLFSFCAAAASSVLGVQAGDRLLLQAVWEIGGAVLLGVLLGLPVALLSGRIAQGQPTLSEAVGIVFVCGGLAIWLDVSFLIASMVLGATVVNLARHHSRPFHAIEGIEWPFMVLFFMLAGASLQLDALQGIPFVAVMYLVARIAGRIAGGWLGARLCGAEPVYRKWIGAAMMPQAGVALGMALVASSRLPQVRTVILPVVIGSTVFFEVLGPLMTRWALVRAGEVERQSPT